MPSHTDQSPFAADPRGAASILIEARFWRYSFYRSYLNLISDASRYHLGWLWWILEPLAMTGVFFVVFTFIRPRGEEFIYFLIVGVTAWLWFSNGVGNATLSLTTAKSLILQMKVPKLIFPAISAITESCSPSSGQCPAHRPRGSCCRSCWRSSSCSSSRVP